MSSSGLIYAVIVGAWAAYLVPMWLRRQDELNEARPTERFSTAIRLLSGRAAMERRVAKARGESVEPAEDAADDVSEDDLAGAVDVRGLAVPATEVRPGIPQGAHGVHGARGTQGAAGVHGAHTAHGARPGVPNPRAKVLARRRRTTTLLFLGFTVGAVAAAVGGVALLWAPAIPAVLLTVYIGQMRRQERRRFEVRIDQRYAAEAARRLRARPEPAAEEHQHQHQAAPAERPAPSPRTADRRALVEQTDHAEWVDQQRAQQNNDDGWEPVPVPLPTYVTAPVAPRTPGGVDPGAPDTWSAARSGTAAAESAPAAAVQESAPAAPQPRRPRPRTPRTPLFDQYADPSDRPRAANE
ncbi:gephyrin-like molybdotransferase receptor GlpR [Streptomyces sp. NPDC093221]|uniref:divisome protein SepX/GlpR n=1 Tax=Streptomyces sp. NPDC093221 TaxID=3366032 RepID=UPI0037F60C73